MAQVTLPYTLRAGEPENVNQLTYNLNALVAGINTVDGTQIASNAITSAKIEDGTIVAGDLNSAIGNFGAWGTWTPTLAASSGPTLGTGATQEGTYVKIGRLVVCRFRVVFGSAGALAGSGGYTITLPVNAATNRIDGGVALGSAWAYDDSASQWAPVTVNMTSAVAADKVRFVYSSSYPLGTPSVVANDAPFTWSNNDALSGSFAYEAAS